MDPYKPIKLNIKTINHKDQGCLSVVDLKSVLPFDIKRCFYIYDIKKGTKRGEHAHFELKQFIWCVKGKLKISAISFEKKTYEFILDKPNHGIYIPNLTWSNQLTLSDDCIYFIAASDYYKESDYIRNWVKFQKILD